MDLITTRCHVHVHSLGCSAMSGRNSRVSDLLRRELSLAHRQAVRGNEIVRMTETASHTVNELKKTTRCLKHGVVQSAQSGHTVDGLVITGVYKGCQFLPVSFSVYWPILCVISYLPSLVHFA